LLLLLLVLLLAADPRGAVEAARPDPRHAANITVYHVSHGG
jgi:hypothetical protein